MIDSSAIEDVVNLTNRIGSNSSFIELVKYSWIERRNCIVVTVGCTSEVAWLTYIRTSDNTSQKRRAFQGNRAGEFTDTIELFQRNHFFVCCNLQYWVSRGVDNQLACFHLTRTKVINNCCTRVWLVSLTNDLATRKLFNLSQDFFWEAIPKSIKRLSNIETHDFPVACHRVFSKRYFLQLGIVAARIFFLRNCLQRSRTLNISQTNLSHVWYIQSYRFGNMSQSI